MTGQELLYSAMDLCGLRDASGNVPGDSADLTLRATAMINILLSENEPLAARIEKRSPSVKHIEALTDTVPMPEPVVRGVLPYALARLICLGEDDPSADRFGRLYESARLIALGSGRARRSGIVEVN